MFVNLDHLNRWIVCELRLILGIKNATSIIHIQRVLSVQKTNCAPMLLIWDLVISYVHHEEELLLLLNDKCTQSPGIDSGNCPLVRRVDTIYALSIDKGEFHLHLNQ